MSLQAGTSVSFGAAARAVVKHLSMSGTSSLTPVRNVAARARRRGMTPRSTNTSYSAIKTHMREKTALALFFVRISDGWAGAQPAGFGVSASRLFFSPASDSIQAREGPAAVRNRRRMTITRGSESAADSSPEVPSSLEGSGDVSPVLVGAWTRTGRDRVREVQQRHSKSTDNHGHSDDYGVARERSRGRDSDVSSVPGVYAGSGTRSAFAIRRTPLTVLWQPNRTSSLPTWCCRDQPKTPSI